VAVEKVVYSSETGANPNIVDSEKLSDDIDPFTKLALEEADHEIKYRTLSWQKTAILLFGEYVCLAILALAWSWSVVGWVCGFFITFGLGIVTWCMSLFHTYCIVKQNTKGSELIVLQIDTSYVLWQFTMKYPQVKNICDIAALLFPAVPRIAYEATAIMLLLNNIFLSKCSNPINRIELIIR